MAATTSFSPPAAAGQRVDRAPDQRREQRGKQREEPDKQRNAPDGAQPNTQFWLPLPVPVQTAHRVRWPSLAVVQFAR
jgi:hypothetical protein